MISPVVLALLPVPKPSQAADHRFGQLPQEAMLVQSLVVETDWKKEIKLLDQRKEVMFQGRPTLLRFHKVAVTNGLGTDSYIGRAIHAHQAVRALPFDAEDS